MGRPRLGRYTRWRLRVVQKQKERRFAKRLRVYEYIIKVKTKRGCFKCGARTNLTIDHIIPLYLGGRPRDRLMKVRVSWIEAFIYLHHWNTQVLCDGCHKRKTREEDSPHVWV